MNQRELVDLSAERVFHYPRSRKSVTSRYFVRYYSVTAKCWYAWPSDISGRILYAYPYWYSTDMPTADNIEFRS